MGDGQLGKVKRDFEEGKDSKGEEVGVKDINKVWEGAKQRERSRGRKTVP